MTADIATVPVAPATFEFSLIGTWWSLPVADVAESERAIQRVLVEAIGRRDDRARLRRMLSERLTAIVADARTVHAEQLYFARDIAPGVPMPVSLGIYWPALRSLPADVAGSPKLARAALKAALAETDAAGAVRAQAESMVAAGAVLRRTYVSDSQVEEGAPVGRILRVDYWITSPASDRFVLLSFSSQLAALEEQLLQLFDAIVSSIRWKQ